MMIFDLRKRSDGVDKVMETGGTDKMEVICFVGGAERQIFGENMGTESGKKRTKLSVAGKICGVVEIGFSVVEVK